MKNDSSSIFYHEDDFCQIELVAAENLEELLKQAENVQDFADKHFTGAGFTDIMVREDHGLKLKERNIKTTELEAVLLNLSLPPCTNITTGIGPGEFESKNTTGYGRDYNGIFFNHESGIVLNIWIVQSIPTEKEKIVITLNEIGQRWNLLLMDWYSLELIDLKNKDRLTNYVEERLQL